jgi:hypothetical protein
MAAEPEKKMEESLHAYARKRREEAGAPLEMHPATRRILQGEVAKLRAAQPEPRPWWQSFLMMWPRFAATVGMVAVLAAGVWVFTQSESAKQTEIAQLSSARPASVDGEAQGDNPGRADELPELAKQLDGTAPFGGVTEADGKKLAAKRPQAASSVLLRDELKLQVRDQERAPAAPAPPPVVAKEGELLREKQVTLRYDTPVNGPAQRPAGQPLSLGVPVLTQTSEDKSGNSGAILYKETQDKRYLQNGREFKMAGPAAGERFAPASTTAITGGVTLAGATANKPADAYDFAPTTNVDLLALGDRANLQIVSPPTALDVATYSAEFVQPPSRPVATATDLAAVNRGDLAKNELSRRRGLEVTEERLGAVTVGEEFERRDGAGSPAVLQKFRLQQFANGTIQIRDADGSVYAGAILTAKADAYDVKAKLSKDETRELDRGRAPAAAAAEPTPGAVWFRASGTNRNRELVVINGELLREEEQLGRAVASAGKAVSGTAGAAPAPATSPAISQSTVTRRAETETATAGSAPRTSRTTNSAGAFTATAIRGRVQIGRTNELELRAVRSR